MEKIYPIFKFVRPLLALVVFCFSFSFLLMLLYKPIPEQNKDTLNIVIGFIFGVTASVGSYYFGTSKDKSDTEQSLRDGPAKIPLNELLAKVKDTSLLMSERQDWLKTLREQYPEYVGVAMEKLP